MKHLRLFEEVDLEWEFDEEETPNIHPDFIDHEQFYKFLVKNEILDRYLFNFKRGNFNNMDLKSFLNKESENKYIDSFLWRQTPEGQDFWDRINNEWQNITYNNIYI